MSQPELAEISRKSNRVQFSKISISKIFLKYLYLRKKKVDKEHFILASALEYLGQGIQEHYKRKSLETSNILLGDKFYSTGLRILSSYKIDYILAASRSLLLVTEGFSNKSAIDFENYMKTFALWHNVADFTDIACGIKAGKNNSEGYIFMLRAALIESKLFNDRINLQLEEAKRKNTDCYKLVLMLFSND